MSRFPLFLFPCFRLRESSRPLNSFFLYIFSFFQKKVKNTSNILPVPKSLSRLLRCLSDWVRARSACSCARRCSHRRSAGTCFSSFSRHSTHHQTLGLGNKDCWSLSAFAFTPNNNITSLCSWLITRIQHPGFFCYYFTMRILLLLLYKNKIEHRLSISPARF